MLQWNHKLKSGALQFTIFMGVLIALILAALILYAYTFIYMKEQSKAAVENIQLLDTGIAYLLKNQKINNDTLRLDFLEKENQTIKVHSSPWGVFEKAFVTVQHRKKRFTKLAIIGSVCIADASPTLYLQDNYQSLSLVGDTKIKGIAYLPSQGVSPGYIRGQSYYGSQLIYGTIKKSETSLPKINTNTLDQLALYSKSKEASNQQDFGVLESNQRLVNSFNREIKNTYSEKTIVLENCEIIGNIVIRSKYSIRIKKTAILQDIILIAPVIEIEDGVNGRFQAMAAKKITVGKECILSYPSALVLYQDNKSNPDAVSNVDFNNQIFIDSGTMVKGSVCYIQTKMPTDFQTQLILERDARIKGQVYSMGNFELKGTVSGSVYTRQFIANQAGSIFVNHIYGGTIENENIPNSYGGILFENGPKTILKWLY